MSWNPNYTSLCCSGFHLSSCTDTRVLNGIHFPNLNEKTLQKKVKCDKLVFFFHPNQCLYIIYIYIFHSTAMWGSWPAADKAWRWNIAVIFSAHPDSAKYLLMKFKKHGSCCVMSLFIWRDLKRALLTWIDLCDPCGVAMVTTQIWQIGLRMWLSIISPGRTSRLNRNKPSDETVAQARVRIYVEDDFSLQRVPESESALENHL